LAKIRIWSYSWGGCLKFKLDYKRNLRLKLKQRLRLWESLIYYFGAVGIKRVKRIKWDEKIPIQITVINLFTFFHKFIWVFWVSMVIYGLVS